MGAKEREEEKVLVSATLDVKRVGRVASHTSSALHEREAVGAEEGGPGRTGTELAFRYTEALRKTCIFGRASLSLSLPLTLICNFLSGEVIAALPRAGLATLAPVGRSQMIDHAFAAMAERKEGSR